MGTISLVALVGLWMWGDQLVPIVDALYSIPPTNAWNEIEVGSPVNFTAGTGNVSTATSYTDKLYLLSDGSINITVGTFP